MNIWKELFTQKTDEYNAIESLKKIKVIFDKHNIRYWLDSGTLLGAIRDNSFIEWDHDIDIGVDINTISEIIAVFDEIKHEGFIICYNESRSHIKLLRFGCEIDIDPYIFLNGNACRVWYVHNIFGQLLDKMLWSSKINGKIRSFIFKLYKGIGCRKVFTSISENFFTYLSSLDFYDMSFPVPKRPKEYLLYKYGNDWDKPKSSYVYYLDDCSIFKGINYRLKNRK